MTTYKCNRPIHPGELIKKELECRRLAQTKVALETGISYKMLNDILNCRRPVTESTAMLLEAALGISADLLIGMQCDYNKQKMAEDPSFAERLKRVRRIAAVL